MTGRAQGAPRTHRPAVVLPRWLLHRTVLFFLALAVAWAGWSGYAPAAARRKIDPGLLQTLAAGRSVNIRVELPFPPEEFHIRFLQERGTVTGVGGVSVQLARVRPDVVWSIGRLYWVRRVRAEAAP